MTSYQRRCDVITSHRRWYDVILTLCAHWVIFSGPLWLLRTFWDFWKFIWGSLINPYWPKLARLVQKTWNLNLFSVVFARACTFMALKGRSYIMYELKLLHNYLIILNYSIIMPFWWPIQPIWLTTINQSIESVDEGGCLNSWTDWDLRWNNSNNNNNNKAINKQYSIMTTRLGCYPFNADICISNTYIFNWNADIFNWNRDISNRN